MLNFNGLAVWLTWGSILGLAFSISASFDSTNPTPVRVLGLIFLIPSAWLFLALLTHGGLLFYY
jgi:hypothetical protein